MHVGAARVAARGQPQGLPLQPASLTWTARIPQSRHADSFGAKNRATIAVACPHP